MGSRLRSGYGGIVLAAIVLWGLGARPATAQVTGAVAGSVKDTQGGVIPGATITLVSETRGVDRRRHQRHGRLRRPQHSR
jgi:hypothetical protein